MAFWSLLKVLPRFFVWILAFIFGMLIFLGDKFAYHLLRYHKKAEYVRRGGCQKTGMCCRNLAIEIPMFAAKWPWFVRMTHVWYRAIFNFHSLGTLQKNWLVYECHYLTKQNTCGIHPYRPKLCREFPLTPLFGHGRLHKGCGFWFVKRSEERTFQGKLVEKAHEQERLEYQARVSEKNLGGAPKIGSKGL